MKKRLAEMVAKKFEEHKKFFSVLEIQGMNPITTSCIDDEVYSFVDGEGDLCVARIFKKKGDVSESIEVYKLPLLKKK